ncbi:MAG TPA: DUF4126 domain-containing protein [Cellvibrionaceae bacterium]
MTNVSLIALALCCAWASGINLYAVLLVLGICGEFNYISLPADIEFLAHPLVIFAAGFMYCAEFCADKIPGVDSGWDFLHTFIRIPAAALLVGAFMNDAAPALEISVLLFGILLAISTHVTKASARLLINTSPEPFSNWSASFGEDVLVFTALWLALVHPVVFLVLLVAFVILIIWLLPKIIRMIVVISNKVRNWLGGQRTAS